MKTYTQKQIEDAKHLYETTCLTNQQIGDELGIPKGTIQMWTKRYQWIRPEELKQIHKMNKTTNMSNNIVLDDTFYKAKNLYENTCLSIPDISKQTDLTIDQLHRRINKYNWQRSKEQVQQMFSNKNKQKYNNYTEEQLKQIKQKMSDTNKQVWARRSEEHKQSIVQHRLDTINNKPQKDILQTNLKISEGVRHTWNNKTDEEKQLIRNKQRDSQNNLSNKAKLEKYKKDRATKHKNNSFKNANSFDGNKFDSKYEVLVYEFCKRNNIPIECQIPVEYQYNNETHITFIDFRIDGILFEVKGGHLLHGIYDYAMPVPIEEKLKVYKEHNIILITDKSGSDIIPPKESAGSNGLLYRHKCPNPLIGVDIDLFDNPQFPFAKDKPECFYKVRVDNKLSALEAWHDENIRWSMIKNRINYVGGFIDNKSILTAMNVTRTCKQPSWFSKSYAKQLIRKYITTDIILDPFAGWGTRCDATLELGKHYYGGDMNNELVKWHQSLNRPIRQVDAINFKSNDSNCSVFICPPYTNYEKYFDGQDLKTTQCEWLKIVMQNIPNAKEYLMVCKVVDKGWEKYIVEEKINKSHLGTNKEYVLLIKN